MKDFSLRDSVRFCGILLLSSLGLSASGFAYHSRAWANTRFETAQRLEQELSQPPGEERTRSDYERVINAYRRVYLGAPASSKAAPSVFAAGELLEEMGRKFKDRDISRKAVEQYEFLRREYPSGKSRAEALYRIGEICRDDLSDHAKAQSVFEDFLKQYPGNDLAGDAQDSLAELKGRSSKKLASAKKPGEEPPGTATAPLHELPAATDTATITREKPVRVTAIRHWSGEGYTRIVIDLDRDVQFRTLRVDHPERIVLDLSNAELDPSLGAENLDINGDLVRKIRASEFKPSKPRIVLEIAENTVFESSLEANPPRLVIDVREKGGLSAETDPDSTVPKKRIVEADDVAPSGRSASSSVKSSRKKPTPPEFLAREARPAADGNRSLIRALGLKIGKIVIDPGHGGHDTGTIGPNGLEEKDLVLDVSLRLGKLLENRLGAEVIYTRSDDTFIPLESRTAIANREAADLFVSVHANSSHDPDARGVETYYLNFTTSPEALEVAARENAVSDQSIHELQDLVKKIALREKIDESREFATDVERALHSGLAAKNPGIRDRGVKKAPFIVLIGANMPSILAEISFVSNPTDAHRLQTADYRQRIAESLYRGIARYANGLSGVKVAGKIEKEQNR